MNGEPPLQFECNRCPLWFRQLTELVAHHDRYHFPRFPEPSDEEWDDAYRPLRYPLNVRE